MRKLLFCLMPLMTACSFGAPEPITDKIATSAPQVEINGTTFQVELASTPYEQQRGLMYRESMPEDSGMLFLFNTARPHKFWMKNTLIPLDIIWINDEMRVVEIITMQPCTESPCPSDGPDEAVRYVLEVNENQFPGKVGDMVSFKNIPGV